MRFSDITGHEQTKQSLRQMVDSGRIPHAILLGGPAGIGKMNLARAFASYVHCKNRHDGDSCGVCPSCRLHDSLNNLDMHFIYPVVKRTNPTRNRSNDYAREWREFLAANPYMPFERWLETLDAGNSQPEIYVAETESILNIASLSPYSEQFKIFVVWLPEKMRTETANKLLKVLEEPFQDTLFVLVSNEPQKMLTTIFSRTLRFNLTRPDLSQIAQALCHEGIDAETAAEGARLSDGNIATALEISRQSTENIEFCQQFQTMMRQAYGRKAADLKKLADKIAGEGREKSRRFLAYMSRMVRENYICNLGVPSLNLQTGAEAEFSKKFAPFIHSGNVEKMMNEIDSAYSDIERNVNGKIVFFDLFLKMMVLIRSKQ